MAMNHKVVKKIWANNRSTNTLHYQFIQSSGTDSPGTSVLIVFLNGLILPKLGWNPAIYRFLTSRDEQNLPSPALLSYDRCGQGDSPPSPLDEDREPGHGHDVKDSVMDLFDLLEYISQSYDLLQHDSEAGLPPIMFVCNSIGCAIARLFAETFPRTVLGMILLDSIMANSDFISIWPDPDAEGFDPADLPSGITPELLRETREKYGKIFHPSVPNKEGLSRRNLAQLLPYSNAPKLVGADGDGLHLTVVGHDWDTFAEQSLEVNHPII